MTRVAALYDIHGNLPALDAVLAEVGEADLVVVGGDFSRGPMPAETVDRLRGLGERVRFIRGNADRPAAGEGVWERAPLGGERLGFLAGLPETVTVDVDGLGSVLFCHGSPRSDEEIITAVTPDERLGRILAGVAEPRRLRAHPPPVRPRSARRADRERRQRGHAVRGPAGRPLGDARPGRRAAVHRLRPRRRRDARSARAASRMRTSSSTTLRSRRPPTRSPGTSSRSRPVDASRLRRRAPGARDRWRRVHRLGARARPGGARLRRARLRRPLGRRPAPTWTARAPSSSAATSATSTA